MDAAQHGLASDPYDTDACAGWVTDCETRSLSDHEVEDLANFWLPSAQGKTFITATQDEIDFFSASFAFIVANADLVRWAVCMAFGPLGVVQCEWLLAYVGGFEHLVINMVDGPLGNGWLGFAIPGTSTISVNRNHSAFQKWLEQWTDSNPDVRLCGVIQLAAGLVVHELTHTVGLSPTDIGAVPAGDCASAYMIQNAFLWAAVKRHPQITSDSCCVTLASDEVFGCGANIYSLQSGCGTSATNCTPNSRSASWLSGLSAPGHRFDEWLASVEEDIEDGLEHIGEWLDAAGDTVGAYFGDVFFNTTGGGTNGNMEICLLCPELCGGGSNPLKGGAEDGAFDSCARKMFREWREDMMWESGPLDVISVEEAGGPQPVEE